MAETFSNFLSKTSMTSGKTQVIVPKANGQAEDGVIGIRPINATSQIHSIYITKEQTGSSIITDIEKEGVYVHIYINDNGAKYYLGHNIQVLPYSSFYIEKTITLLSHQSLCVEYSSLNANESTIDCICSGVDIVE